MRLGRYIVELGAEPKAGWGWSGPVAGVVLGVAMSALVLLWAGLSPTDVFLRILEAGFTGGWYAWNDTLTKATPILLCALACGVAFRAGLWNVGAEGQLFLGAWAATGVASFWLAPGVLGRPGTLVLMAVAAIAVGGALGAVIGVLRARFNTNEILTSLMFVYIASHWNNWFIYSVWSDRGFQMTPLYPQEAWLPRLGDLAVQQPKLAGFTLHLGLLVALLAALVLWWVLERRRWGFELRLMGLEGRLAKYAGVSVTRTTVWVMAVSGGLAGLAGMLEVSGVVHRLQENFSPGYGFSAILVAWLARLNPAWMVIVSILFAGLLVGARQVQPGGVAMAVQGALLARVVGMEMVGRLRWRRANP